MRSIAGKFVAAEGCELAFDCAGAGLSVAWQHGLGGDRSQAADTFPSEPEVLRITLECRGHGQSDLGNPTDLSISTYANDLILLLDLLRVDRAVVGGISLGAAVALRVAARHPDRVAGLILGRPAWFVEKAPANLAIYRELGECLEHWGAHDGATRFASSPQFKAIQAVSPDNAASLQSFFLDPNTARALALVQSIPFDGPGVTLAEVQALSRPALIVTTDHDALHPESIALSLAKALVGSTVTKITAKSLDKQAHYHELHRAISGFLGAMRERR